MGDRESKGKAGPARQAGLPDERYQNVSEEGSGWRFAWWEGEGVCHKGEGTGLLWRKTVSGRERARPLTWLCLCSLGEKPTGALGDSYKGVTQVPLSKSVAVGSLLASASHWLRVECPLVFRE